MRRTARRTPGRSRAIRPALGRRPRGRPEARPPVVDPGPARGSLPDPSIGGSVPQLLEQGRLHGVGRDAARRRDQRPDLTSADVAPTAELDALEPAETRPGADG